MGNGCRKFRKSDLDLINDTVKFKGWQVYSIRWKLYIWEKVGFTELDITFSYFG